MSSELNVLPPSPPINETFIINPSNIESEQNNDIFIFGQFLYVNDANDKEMLQNAWTAITQLDLWDYMKRDTDSYMMSSDPEINIITKKMEELGYDGHSGSSFGWTMRQMQHIAQYGEDDFMDTYITNNK
jgi:hypothetical protein